MRLLAIDFGERRVGLAIGDDTTGLALPHGTIRRQSDAGLLAELARIAREEEVDMLVLGEPRTPDGGPTETTARVDAFAGKLDRLGLPVERVVETLTSVEATERLLAAGGDPRRHRERLDALAAQILAEEALARRARRRPETP